MQQATGMTSDDFLKLFIAQLQNQDPLSPQDPSAMLTQLAQINQVEQSYNTNTALQNLLTAQNNVTTMNSASLIGKTIVANGNAVSFDGTTSASLQYNLSVPTASTTVTITDASGQTVRTVSLGAQSAGDTSFAWDGKDNNGATLPAGTYTFAVTGTTAAGASVTATTYTTGLVSGVSFAGDTPSLTIGSASVALTDVISVKGV
jgi:flagellar basal-body rod modification protein FlgD